MPASIPSLRRGSTTPCSAPNSRSSTATMALPNVPNALAFAKTKEDNNILELFFTQKTVARPFIAPPGVPAQRLALLRSAFAALATDRDFLADAEKSNLEVEPLSGEEVDKIVALITSAPPGVAERYSKAFATP